MPLAPFHTSAAIPLPVPLGRNVRPASPTCHTAGPGDLDVALFTAGEPAGPRLFLLPIDLAWSNRIGDNSLTIVRPKGSREANT
jgi:hypothetical protein